MKKNKLLLLCLKLLIIKNLTSLFDGSFINNKHGNCLKDECNN